MERLASSPRTAPLSDLGSFGRRPRQRVSSEKLEGCRRWHVRSIASSGKGLAGAHVWYMCDNPRRREDGLKMDRKVAGEGGWAAAPDLKVPTCSDTDMQICLWR